MRGLTNCEILSVAGGECGECEFVTRDDFRSASVKVGLAVGPVVGWQIGSELTRTFSVSLGWIGSFAFAGVGIMAGPVLLKFGTELGIRVHDYLLN